LCCSRQMGWGHRRFGGSSGAWPVDPSGGDDARAVESGRAGLRQAAAQARRPAATVSLPADLDTRSRALRGARSSPCVHARQASRISGIAGGAFRCSPSAVNRACLSVAGCWERLRSKRELFIQAEWLRSAVRPLSRSPRHLVETHGPDLRALAWSSSATYSIRCSAAFVRKPRSSLTRAARDFLPYPSGAPPFIS
jgi:hypothetical protein